MHLLYYSYIDRQEIEFESDNINNIIEKIITFDLYDRFEIQISNSNSALLIKKYNSIYYFNLFFEEEENKNRIGIQSNDYTFFETVLNKYLEEDKIDELKEIFTNFKKLQKDIEISKYNKWKKEYEVSNKSKKRRIVKNSLLLSILILFTILIGYLFFSEEYKFIGQSTHYVKAEIIEIKNIDIPPHHFVQKIKFKYLVENKNFYGETKIGKSVGIRYIGDKIKIKISKKHPRNYKIIGYY